MSDRFNALTVTLEKDMREDDAKAIMDAIRCLRGVMAVSGHVADLNSHAAFFRVRNEMLQKVLEICGIPESDRPISGSQ